MERCVFSADQMSVRATPAQPQASRGAVALAVKRLLVRESRLSIDPAQIPVRSGPDTGAPASPNHPPAPARAEGGARLVYQGASTIGEALNGIEVEIQRFGQCLVVANTAYLPWSSAGPDAQAPHFLL